MRNYKEEWEGRVAFIQDLVAASGVSGIVYGNSGGKDCALVSILCKAACENTLGLIMPCASRRNYEQDLQDAMAVAEAFGIETRVLDLTPVQEAELHALSAVTEANRDAIINIAPRLRMTSLYAVAASENRLVAGTGNRSERYMGYFPKWGDGACDFNPIADLTATEVLEFLDFLKAPRCVIDKAPSAGLYEGQTDEQDMGISYKAIDDYLCTGQASCLDRSIIERFHNRSEHKRRPIPTYKDE